MPGQARRTPLFAISTWNICGISNVHSIFDDKSCNKDFLDSINRCDIIVLTETWHYNRNFTIPGFKSFILPPRKLNRAKGGRCSGGLAVLFKEQYEKYVLPLKSENNFLWFKISKELLHINSDIYALCSIYSTRNFAVFFHRYV